VTAPARPASRPRLGGGGRGRRSRVSPAPT